MTFSCVRTRFAPSPTGFLHIGGARTALFNWLFARANHGAFILRIEDTDLQRSSPQFTQDIVDSLKWLGMNPDEPIVYQSKRFARYHEVINHMLESNVAYRCRCTTEDLGRVRAQCEKDKKPFRYPGTCREKNITDLKTAVRARVVTEGKTGFEDCIRGRIVFHNRDLDDWVIQRTDGSPTYNFAVVVDDHDQKISHVLRGDDHINNTPKQIQLYQALGYDIPRFAHLPMILGTDRTKLSKRHGAASTLEYRRMGYLPVAIINFLARLGWSHGDQEIFTVNELCSYFSLDSVGKANAIFNTEKLNWVNGHLCRDTPAAHLLNYLNKHFANEMSFCSQVAPTKVEKAISAIQGKVKLLPELIEQLRCLFDQDPDYQDLQLSEQERETTLKFLHAVLPELLECPFEKDSLEAKIRGLAEARGEKLAAFARALRVAITGGKVSPSLFEMMELIGKPVVVRRIENALSHYSIPQ